MSDIKPMFSGEAQFVTYADSSKGGPRITLRLPDRDQLQAFIGKEGKRFMVVLVEIGDDERPVQPAQQEKPKGGELAKLAGIWCRDPVFLDFIRPVYDRVMGGDGRGWGDVSPNGDFDGSFERYARHAICVICDVQRRAELDTDQAAAAVFHKRIRQPFLAYQKTPVTA